MPENVQNIINKIGEWWKKFSIKQKTLLVSITAVIAGACNSGSCDESADDGSACYL